MDTSVLEDVKTDKLVDYSKLYNILIWNDDFNDMGWIIVALKDICEVDDEQAYEIMKEAHDNGKASAKTGEYDELVLMQKKFSDREINTTIEMI